MSFRGIDFILPHHAFSRTNVSTNFHGHVTNSQNCFEIENRKERAFTFERTCFDITFCTGSGRRTPALRCAKNSYGPVQHTYSRGISVGVMKD